MCLYLANRIDILTEFIKKFFLIIYFYITLNKKMYHNFITPFTEKKRNLKVENQFV